MKSFSQFWEEASLSDLQRKHAQSAEGRREERRASRHRAEREAKKRRAQVERIKREQRNKMLSKQQQEPSSPSITRKDPKALQRAETRGREIRKGITKLGKVTFKGIKKSIQKRKKNSETN